jgi:hypothetical protein
VIITPHIILKKKMSVEEEEENSCVVCDESTDNWCEYCKHYMCDTHIELTEWLLYEEDECVECIYTCYSCATHGHFCGWFHKNCKTLKEVCNYGHTWYVCEKALHGDDEEMCGQCFADRNYCKKRE